MAHNIKAILLDIDGTLTNDQKVITPRTREALLKCQEKGVVLVLASGRTANGLSTYAADLDLAHHGGVLACYNGAKSLNCETGQVYFEQSMTVEQGKRVLEHMKKFNVAPVIDHGEYMYVNDCFSGQASPSVFINREAGRCVYLRAALENTAVVPGTFRKYKGTEKLTSEEGIGGDKRQRTTITDAFDDLLIGIRECAEGKHNIGGRLRGRFGNLAGMPR